MATDSKIQFRDTTTSISSPHTNALKVVAQTVALTGSLHVSSSAEGEGNGLLNQR